MKVEANDNKKLSGDGHRLSRRAGADSKDIQEKKKSISNI